MQRLSRQTILEAFAELSRTLNESNQSAELALAGGAAMVLLFDARQATKDVDIVVLQASDANLLRRAAADVAARLELPDDWLNEGVKGYIQGLAPGEVVFRSASLVIHSLAPHQLLAMKLSAWRDDVDIDDARKLLSRLPQERSQAWQMIEPHLVPGRQLKARYAFDDLWESERGTP